MLESDQIYLRRFQVGDAPILLKWGKNNYYHKSAGFEQYQNLEQAQKGAKQYAMRPNSYVICLKKNKQVIGLVELYERGMDKQSGLLKTKEIGFLLDKNFAGHGYMTQALLVIFDYAFKKLKQTELWAGTFADNIHSQKFLSKLGFKYVYTVDYRQISHLFSYKEKYYLLQKEDWLKINENTRS